MLRRGMIHPGIFYYSTKGIQQRDKQGKSWLRTLSSSKLFVPQIINAQIVSYNLFQPIHFPFSWMIPPFNIPSIVILVISPVSWRQCCALLECGFFLWSLFNIPNCSCYYWWRNVAFGQLLEVKQQNLLDSFVCGTHKASKTSLWMATTKERASFQSI